MDTTINVITGEIKRSALSIGQINQREIQRQEFAASTVRDDRNAKLSESDWTQVADAPVDKAAWATYRQALRDIPSQAGFPNEVVWPVEP